MAMSIKWFRRKACVWQANWRCGKRRAHHHNGTFGARLVPNRRRGSSQRTDHLKSKGLGLKPAMHATKGVHRHHRRKKESPMSYLLIRRVTQASLRIVVSGLTAAPVLV